MIIEPAIWNETVWSTPLIVGQDRDRITDLILRPAEEHIKEYMLRNNVLIMSEQAEHDEDLWLLRPVDSGSIVDNLGRYPMKFKILKKKDSVLVASPILPFVNETTVTGGTECRVNDEYYYKDALVCLVHMDESAPSPQFSASTRWVEEADGIKAVLTIRIGKLDDRLFRIGWKGL